MFLRKAWSLCSQSEWVDVLQEQQLLYNKLVNMSCVTSMGVYYRTITRADRWGQENHPSPRTHGQTRGLWGCTTRAPPAPAEIILLFLHSAPTTNLEMADFAGQMERGPKKPNSFLNPLPASTRAETEGDISRGCEQGGDRALPALLQHWHKELSMAAMSFPCTTLYSHPLVCSWEGAESLFATWNLTWNLKRWVGEGERERQ